MVEKVKPNKIMKNENFILRLITNEAVLVPAGPGATDPQNIYYLNAVAMRIWQLINDDNSTEEIAESISQEFNVTKDIATSDVNEYLEELEKIGAIQK